MAGPQGPTEIVSKATFAIRRGEALGVVGESGCGKTTIALAILGLLPRGARVAGGECWFDGRDLLALGPKERAALRGREIGFVSQDPMAALDPTYTVGSLLRELVRRHTGASKAEAASRALELLHQVRLPDPERVARLYPHEISGGMAQRVSIAAATAGDPKLLVADEPTTALDVTVQAEIIELLRTLQHERGMAVLLVSHDLGVIASLCDRTVAFYAGQVVEYAPTPELIDAPGHPYTRALLACDPQLATPGEPIPTIAGTVGPPASWALSSGCRFAPRCPLRTEDCVRQPIDLDLAPSGRATRCIHHQALVPDRRFDLVGEEQ